MTKNARKLMRQERNRALKSYYGEMDLQNMPEEEKDNLFAAISSNSICTIPCTTMTVSKVEENTMNTTTNTFESERRSLRDLHFALERDKNLSLRKEHHMDLYQPKTFAELKQLLKDGKVTVHPDYSDDEHDDVELSNYDHASSYLVFNYQKPNRQAYRDGYAKIEKESAKLKTQIAVLPPEEALKKLEVFESKTFH